MYMQGDLGGKVNILGRGQFHSLWEKKKKSSYKHVSNSEWLLRLFCLNLQIQKHHEW